MPSISLTLPTAGTVITAGLHATNYTTLQTLLNGGLDTANWASGKIFAPSKLMQEAASNGQVLAWDNASSTWKPATLSSSPAYGITLPGGPTDGQEAILVDSITLPTYQWRFRWNAGSSNADKWEFMGGDPLVVQVATAETTASGAYVDLATVGPSFTAPRAGQYYVAVMATAANSSATQTPQMGIKVGAGATVDELFLRCETATAKITCASVPSLKTVAASDVIKPQYLTTGGTVTFSGRRIVIVPLRVS